MSIGSGNHQWKHQPLWPERMGRKVGAIALSGVMAITYGPSTAIAQTLTSPNSRDDLPVQRDNSQSLPTGTVAPLAPVPVQGDSGYILGPGDRLKIDIFNVPEYSGEYMLLSDGTVNMPLAGTISLQGMTISQASEEIASAMGRFLRRPITTITLLTVRPIKIAIAGEVNRPGSYSVDLNRNQSVNIPTVTGAIELAGGITQSADIRRIQVRRPRPYTGEVQSSGTKSAEIITVDLWQLLQTADLSQDIILRDGDSILIPTIASVNLNETPQLAAASFASNTGRALNIAVVGEVKRPGPYTLSNSQSTNAATVTQGIQAAGGITQEADIRNILVRRRTKSGSDRLVEVNFWKLLQTGDLRQDLPLQEGDTIVVGTAKEMSPDEITELASASFSPENITVNIVGEAIRPGRVEVRPNTPLTQALLAAGGFNNDAQKGEVELIRLNPNGTVSRQTLPVDFSQGLNEENNPALRNNDTIVVRKSGARKVADAVNPILSILGTVGGVFAIPRIIDGFFD